MNLRAMQPDDVDRLGAIMLDAVRATGAGHYDDAHLEAWSRSCTAQTVRDLDAGGRTWVVGEPPVAFLTVRAGHIELLYTHPAHGRQGHARTLIQHAQRHHRSLTSEASSLSAPLFAACGFRDEGPVERPHHGVAFTNRRMVWP